jgi:methylated-DNA-[protein]-cysteine S-methyltransferase
MSLSFALFPTAIGDCAIVWGESGVAGLQLPEADPERARALIRRRFPEAEEVADLPPPIAAAIDDIASLARGEPRPLDWIELDFTGIDAFRRRVYRAARAVAPGTTTTYGALAEAIGAAGEARAVGSALGGNPFPIVVPCHRVLAAGGKAGGFSAHGGVETKLRLLTIERARTNAEPSLFAEGELPLRIRR